MKLAIVTAIWKRPHITALWLKHHQEICEQVGARLVVAWSPDGDMGSANQIQELPTGLTFVPAANQPLGAKWNAAVKAAEGADAILILGSDDFASREYVEAGIKLLEKHPAFGIRDFLVLDSINGIVRHWPGYKGPREGEPIGSGRFIRGDALDELDWAPWEPGLPRDLDASCRKRLLATGTPLKTFAMKELGSLLAVKSGEDIDHSNRLPGKTVPWRSITDVYPTWLTEELADMKRTWTLGLDVVARGDAIAGLDTLLRTTMPVVDEAHVLLDNFYGQTAEWVVDHHGAHVIHEQAPFYARPGPDGFRHIHFGQAREIVRKAGNTDWALVIDADEDLMDPADLLYAIDRAERNGVTTVSVGLLIWTAEGGVRKEQIRAFRRDACSWVYPVHNRLIREGETVRSKAMIRTSYVGLGESRYVRSVPALRKMWAEADSDDERIHASYYLAKAAGATGRWEEVIEWAGKCIGLAPDDKGRAEAWLWLVEATRQLAGFAECSGIIRTGLEHHPAYDGLLYYAAEFAAGAWLQAALQQDYSGVFAASRVHLAQFNQAAALLGWQVGTEPR